jgi:hypothetical protein
MIEALRRGYVGLVQWDMYDVRYDRAMHYGVIGDAKGGWQLKPGYWVLKMFTHAAKPGWRAVGVGVTDPNIQATAVKGDDGEMAVFVLNRDKGIKAVRVNGLRDGRVRLITWNQEGNGRLSSDATEAWVTGAQVQLICPGESIVAVTP